MVKLRLKRMGAKKAPFYRIVAADAIGRLIGKQGSMANSIRQMLQVASKIENKRISIKFEAI